MLPVNRNRPVLSHARSDRARTAVGVLLVCGAVCRGEARVVLCDPQGPRFDVVLPKDASGDEKTAAEELRGYLQRMSGAAFTTHAGSNDRPSILVGRADHLADVDTKALGPDAFLIDVEPKRIRLIGGDARAVHYAVSTFLEDLGVRWVMPGTFGEVVPKRNPLTATVGRRIEKPDFEYRQILCHSMSAAGRERFEQWGLRNKLGTIAVQQGHNWTASLPKNVSLKTHPEYYALVDGRRQASQVCTTHPDVIRLVTATVNRYFDAHPEVISYALCPDDNMEFCECPRCRALDVGGVDAWSGKPVLSDRVIRFVNAVARGIQARHPGKMVTTYAYSNHVVLPRSVAVDPHVVIMFTTNVFCSIHGIGDPQCKSRMRMKKILADWAEQASRVYVFEYDPFPYNAELPCPLYGQRGREMPLYKAMGIRGFLFLSSPSWATLTPNSYINAKLMWNSRADVADLLDDLCRAFFGPAAGAMKQYYDDQERAFSEYRGEMTWSLRDLPQAFTETRMGRMGVSLAQAERAAAASPYRERVAMVRHAYDYLRHYLAARRTAPRGTFADYQAHLNEAEQSIDILAGLNEDFIQTDLARQQLRGMDEATVSAFAKEAGFVTSWWLIGPFGNADNQGHARPYPPETEVNIQAKYPGATGEVGWFRHIEPDGRAYVDLARAIHPNEWVCAYALTFVDCPDRRRVQIRFGSNDSGAVFLNGRRILNRHVARQATVDEDIVPADLKPGRNTVLVKISQMGRAWGFYFRITDPAGRPQPDLAFTLDP